MHDKQRQPDRVRTSQTDEQRQEGSWIKKSKLTGTWTDKQQINTQTYRQADTHGQAYTHGPAYTHGQIKELAYQLHPHSTPSDDKHCASCL